MSSLPRIGEEPVVVRPDASDASFGSVTTVIGVADKPALVAWAALETSKAAVYEKAVWQSRLEHEGEEAAIEWLKKARFRRRKGERSSTELGTAVHKAAEHKVIHGTWRPEDGNDPELRPFLVQFDHFLEDFAPEWIAAEVTVFNVTYGYAGTADGFFRLDGVPLIYDIKTSREDYLADGKLRTPFPEVGWQLAAYSHGEFAAVWRARLAEQFKRRYYLLSKTEQDLAVPVPETAGGVALLLTPTRYALHPVRCDDVVFESFLHLVDVAHYVFETAPSVVGAPLIPPRLSAQPLDDPFAGLPS